MVSTSDNRLPRGMRDLLPAAARQRQAVIAALVSTFESYGFEPLETPALERAETLLGKYGPDAERLIYRARLADDDDLALRYDFSVPLARVSATYDGLPRPFRRYQVGPVWRGERPQRGRYREFVQADLDIVGSASMLADAEIITIVIRALDSLGFPATLTKINNRKVLSAIGRYAGVPDELLPGLYRSIDKLEKVGLDGVRLELASVGLPSELLNRERQAVGRWMEGRASRARIETDLAGGLGDDAPASAREAVAAFLDDLELEPRGIRDDEVVAEATGRLMAKSVVGLRAAYASEALVPRDAIDRLLQLLGLADDNRTLLADLRRQLDASEAEDGLRELGQLLDSLEAVGIEADRYAIDFSMVRGLDYYTGTIFETTVPYPPIGSITGGGRFDHLVGLFGRELPAVGTSFGVDRLVEAMVDLGIAAADRPSADVLVTLFDETTSGASARFAERLRSAGVRVESYLERHPLGEQIRYALRRGVPLVAVLGPDEMASGTVAIRNLPRKSQESYPVAEAAAAVRAALRGGTPALGGPEGAE